MLSLVCYLFHENLNLNRWIARPPRHGTLCRFVDSVVQADTKLEEIRAALGAAAIIQLNAEAQMSCVRVLERCFDVLSLVCVA